MGRPKLKKSEKKVNLGITISKEANSFLDRVTFNKSKFIEDLVNESLKKSIDSFKIVENI